MAKVDDELRDFIREALAQSLSREQIKSALAQAGWPSDQIANALSAFAVIDFPLPVPKPKPYLSAREAFLYLILFTTLYISAYNLGSIIFQFINRAFPDPAVSGVVGEYISYSIRWSVSSLIVAFPIFLYVSYRINRAVKLDPVKRASKIRKWLTYITLFIAASVLIGDLTTLVFNLLGGELTVRFVLKVLTVGVIAGTIFGYYLWDLRQEEREG
jgi:hypothetical protein